MAGLLEEKGPYETFVDRYDDEDTYNGRPIHEAYPHTIAMRVSRKDAPTPSDRFHSTHYSRVVSEVKGNTPATFRSGDGSPLNTVHLSGIVGGADTSLGHPYGFGLELDNIEQRSLTDARNRLASSDTFNVGVALGEALSTAEMLGDAGGALARALINFRRRAFSYDPSYREYLLATAGAWLVGYYGWGSLANDAFGLHAALKSKAKDPLYITASSTNRVSRSYSPTSVNAVVDVAVECEGLVKVGYKAQVENAFTREVERWGLINPFTIAWELVPFSFCVDWVTPIGNVLSSLSADAGLKLADGYVTRRSKSNYKYSYNNKNPYKQEYDLRGGTYNVESLHMLRRLSNGFEIPGVYVRSDPFKNSMRIANGLALITQAVLR